VTSIPFATTSPGGSPPSSAGGSSLGSDSSPS